MNFLTRALTVLNTKHIFGVGLGTVLTSVAVQAAAPTLGHTIDAHLGTGLAGALARGYLDVAVSAANVALPPGIAALAAGKPIWLAAEAQLGAPQAPR
ncbi:MAG: hypothetical protein JWN27_2882 [Candidatus Eremiobacteraeota bacterium]|nr:hypothetical protein [Candidatus Eremiobacteraeota bacterium]